MHDQLKEGLYMFNNTQLNLKPQSILKQPSTHLHSTETSNSSCFTSIALSSKKPITLVSSTSPFALWHNRLGLSASHILFLLYLMNVISFILIKDPLLFVLLVTWVKSISFHFLIPLSLTLYP